MYRQTCNQAEQKMYKQSQTSTGKPGQTPGQRGTCTDRQAERQQTKWTGIDKKSTDRQMNIHAERGR